MRSSTTRGWSLSGSVRFQRSSAADGSQSRSPRPGWSDAYGGCSAFYSCRSGRHVLINDDRWRLSTRTYRRARLDEYRALVVNHEVGHVLEFGHARYERRGTRARP